LLAGLPSNILGPLLNLLAGIAPPALDLIITLLQLLLSLNGGDPLSALTGLLSTGLLNGLPGLSTVTGLLGGVTGGSSPLSSLTGGGGSASPLGTVTGLLGG